MLIKCSILLIQKYFSIGYSVRCIHVFIFVLFHDICSSIAYIVIGRSSVYVITSLLKVKKLCIGVNYNTAEPIHPGINRHVDIDAVGSNSFITEEIVAVKTSFKA